MREERGSSRVGGLSTGHEGYWRTTTENSMSTESAHKSALTRQDGHLCEFILLFLALLVLVLCHAAQSGRRAVKPRIVGGKCRQRVCVGVRIWPCLRFVA